MPNTFKRRYISGVTYTEVLWKAGAPCHDFTIKFGRRIRRRLKGAAKGTGMRYKGDPGHHQPGGGAPLNTRRNKGKRGEGPRGNLRARIKVTTRAAGLKKRTITARSDASYSVFVHEGTGDYVGSKWKHIPKNFGYRKQNRDKSTYHYRGQRANPYLTRAVNDQGKREGLWKR